MRIGIGYDIHRLAQGRPLVLGGARIPFAKGLIGHSDADVVLHAVSDALLGAAAMGDIGKHFPEADPEFKDSSSLMLLGRVCEMLDKGGYAVNNVDVVVVAEKPSIGPFADAMKKNISAVLKIDPSRVGIKASTNEGIGSVGRGEAVASYAAVTLKEGKT